MKIFSYKLKWFFSVLCTIVFSFLLINFAYAADETIINKETDLQFPDIQKIVKSGKLVVGLPAVDRHLLFEADKNGELHGYYIDFAKKLAKELGVSVEFNRSSKSFNDLVDVVARDDVDVAICHLSKTLDRARKVLYADTDVTLYQTLVINRLWLVQHGKEMDNDDPVKIFAKEHPRVGVSPGTSYVEFAHDMFPNAIIKEYPWPQSFTALMNGEVDAIFDDDFKIKEYLLRNPYLILKFRTIVLKDHPDFIAMAVSPKHGLFVYWLNRYLEINNIKMDANKLLQYGGYNVNL